MAAAAMWLVLFGVLHLVSPITEYPCSGLRR